MSESESFFESMSKSENVFLHHPLRRPVPRIGFRTSVEATILLSRYDFGHPLHYYGHFDMLNIFPPARCWRKSWAE